MKKFPLSEQLTRKWVAALESGNYHQIQGTLIRNPKKDQPIPSGNCCLGVLLLEAGVEKNDIHGYAMIAKNHCENTNVPNEFIDIQVMFSSLNDGVTDDMYRRIVNTFPATKGVIKKPTISINTKHNFNEIANIIKHMSGYEFT